MAREGKETEKESRRRGEGCEGEGETGGCSEGRTWSAVIKWPKLPWLSKGDASSASAHLTAALLLPRPACRSPATAKGRVRESPSLISPRARLPVCRGAGSLTSGRSAMNLCAFARRAALSTSSMVADSTAKRQPGGTVLMLPDILMRMFALRNSPLRRMRGRSTRLGPSSRCYQGMPSKSTDSLPNVMFSKMLPEKSTGSCCTSAM